MKRIFLAKLLGWSVLVLGVLAVVAAGGFYLWLRSSLPITEGNLQVQGIAAPVEVVRDRAGIPHIRARSEADALFGLGYVHAQDRLWQMEFQRRIGFGRLSEVLGETTLDNDRFLRTLGTGRAARRAWRYVRPAARRLIEAYTAGINAFITTHHGRELPIEFTVLGFEPEPWRPEDVLVWAKIVALNLSGNWNDELLRSSLVGKVGAARADQLMPAYTSDGPVILPRSAIMSTAPRPTRGVPQTATRVVVADQLSALGDSVRAWLGVEPLAVGSNNWVVAGSRTATGKPLLAGDPHLGTQMPSVWYLAHVQGGKLDAIGASFPGLPGFPIGHNGRIAWAVTNLEADVQDLYIEKLDATGRRYLHNDHWQPIEIVSEVIKVKGRPDVRLEVRLTRHGPLISDVTSGTSEPLAMRWTALDAEDHSIEAYMALNIASDWRQFTAALSGYRVPSQNFVYADTAGNIGYHAAGVIPVRARGDGRLPVPGWQDTHEWRGFVPFAALPQTYNPPEGFIASANNRVAPDSYPYLLSTNWAPPYRAERLVERLGVSRKLSPADMADVQQDVQSLYTRRLLPLLLRVRPDDKRARQAVVLLKNWDGKLTGDSAGAAVFWAWYQQIPGELFADELGESLAERYFRQGGLLGKVVPGVLASSGQWCDDIRTPVVEDCQVILERALVSGLARMSEQQGTQTLADWRWDRVHQVRFPHNPFDKVALLKPLFSRNIGNGGDSFTVNVGSVSLTEPYNQPQGVSYRQIVDLADLDASRFISTTGQSGQFQSSRYADQLEPWQRGSYLPMRFGRAAVASGTEAKLVLNPQKSSPAGER